MHPMRQIIQSTDHQRDRFALIEARDQKLQFHPKLNTHLWKDGVLKPIVRLKLFQNAVAFYNFLAMPGLVVIDIIFTGSNAAFNYTPLSDIDVHLIVDLEHTSCPKVADNLFLTKKALWGETYAITIHGLPVELYVEDMANPVHANGIFSILHNRWLKRPSPTPPMANDNAVASKRTALAATIEELLSGDPTLKDVDDMLVHLHTLRRSGLMAFGEFGVENLVYKALRDAGLIDKLYQKRITIRDQMLSL
jgi:hypothetical protein